MKSNRWIAGLLAACLSAASVAAPRPSFAKRLQLTYDTVSAVRDDVSRLLAAKRISVSDARNLQLQADIARAGLGVAREMYLEHCQDAVAAGTRPSLGVAESTCTFAPASAKLTLTLELARAMQRYLAKL